MKCRKIMGALVGLGLLGTAGAASATLIGDTVTMGHHFPTTSDTAICPVACGGLTDVVVQAGSGDATQPYFPGENWYVVDVEASSFSVVYNRPPSWAGAVFNGLIITDMDWVGAPGSIVGLSVSTNLGGFDNSRVTFTEDSVSINWQGLSFAAGTRWDIDLTTRHNVPEPTTLLLLGFGLAGLGFARKRLQ